MSVYKIKRSGKKLTPKLSESSWPLQQHIYMGYWPSVRSRWLDIDQVLFMDSASVHKLPKNRPRPISSHLNRTSLVNKGFITWLSGKFFLRDTAGSPERARLLYLARSGSQSQRRILFILRAHGASHIIKIYTSKSIDWHQGNTEQGCEKRGTWHEAGSKLRRMHESNYGKRGKWRGSKLWTARQMSWEIEFGFAFD